jgi:hypothetical protein
MNFKIFNKKIDSIQIIIDNYFLIIIINITIHIFNNQFYNNIYILQNLALLKYNYNF